MIKPESLRAHLTAALPALARDPEQLLIFIDNGKLAANLAPGLSFEYRYTLTIILTDFAEHPDSVMVPLLTWIAVNQPDLMANYDNRGAIAFEAELIDASKVDLSIKIPLSESVGVHARAGEPGVYDVEHYPEPVLEPNLVAGHWQLYVKGELAAEWDTPAA